MPPFAATVISRPHRPYGLFMALFIKMVTVFLPVYDFQLVLRFSMITTVMEGKSKGFAVYFEADNLLSLQVTSSHSPTMARDISPLHTQPRDTAPETELPNSLKVQRSLDMGAQSTVGDAVALGVG